MGLYSRQQLAVLLVLLAAAAIGLGVRHWRATYPELADALERLDREAEPVRARQDRDADGAPARASSRGPKLAPPPGPETRLDLNRATADDLQRLPGVGPALAARIVQARHESGPFASIDDLGRVKGLGPVKLDRLRAFVGVVE
jgi:competence ComEA-like helix-hairpin-helix protein